MLIIDPGNRSNPEQYFSHWLDFVARRLFRGRRRAGAANRGRPMRPVWLLDRALHATTWVPVIRLTALATMLTAVLSAATVLVIALVCQAFGPGDDR